MCLCISLACTFKPAPDRVPAQICLSMSEFRRFLRDIKVLDTHVTREFLDLLFIRVNYLTPEEEVRVCVQ
jgi:hypothetical protein